MLNSNAETDAAGNALDKTEFSTGFQVGMTAQLPLSDVFGVQGELLYSQRGGIYKYTGPGYLNVAVTNGTYNLTGNVRYLMRYSNGYIELPLMVYVKPIKKLKIELGVSPMILIAAAGRGEHFINKLVASNPNATIRTDSLAIPIDGDYLGVNDKDQQYDRTTIANVQPNSVSIQGDSYYVPGRVGAYYFNTNRVSNAIASFDLSANAGIVYNLTGGLSLGLRASYGLLDTTPAAFDVYRSKNTGTSTGATSGLGKTTDFQPIERPNTTNNFNVGLTIGFTF